MGEVAGYKQVRDGMTFTTIHGVGHMAPQWSPEPVQEMILSWTQGNF
jgi:carboxypeptidase C (cathepsin A)